MLKGKEIIGRKIIAIDSGKQVETVRDIVFDHQGNQVLAFLTDEGGWFHAAHVVPFSQVHSIGADAVMIGGEEDVVSAREQPQIQEALSRKDALIGTNLVTTDGKELGRIADVFFDETSGQVVGYEATGGFFSDLSSGRTFVPAPEKITIGSDAAIVPPEVALAMEEQAAGGFQGALQRTGQSVSEGVAGVNQNLNDSFSNLSDSVKSTAGNLADATRERQKTYVVGKTAGSDVSAQDGTLIVSRGGVISAAQAELADTHGALGSLTAAATGGALQDATQSARDSVQSGYDSARTNVQQGYENVASATRERQKEYVVGKLAGSDVRADDGTLIVSRGETISPAQADAADARGLLGSLTASATGGSVQGSVQNASQTTQGSVVYITSGTDGGGQIGGEPTGLLGRRVQRDVYGTDRSFIAAQGQIVTAAVLERAQAMGKEQELREAVGGTVISTVGSAAPLIDTDALSGHLQNAGDKLSQGAQSVRESAGGFLDRAKSWLKETQDKAVDATDEARVNGAVGRPVNRVILDRQDNIILNVGEIVTFGAVERAREAEVLDMLLGSVSTETPHIDPLATRPNQQGDAALDSTPKNLGVGAEKSD